MVSTRVLYLSQLAPRDRLRRWGLPDESVTIPPVFDALGADADVVDVVEARPPAPEGYDGVVIGGSVGSCNDDDVWRRHVEEWFRSHTDVPTLAICGGHQIMAKALGGSVTNLPARQVGVFRIVLDGVDGFGGEVIQTHGEGVVRVPDDAVVWSRDDLCVQALRYSNRRWSVQFHPEVTAESARLLLASFKERPEAWPDDTLAPAVESGRALLRAWIAGL